VAYRRKPSLGAGLIEKCVSLGLAALVEAGGDSILLDRAIVNRLPGTRAIGPALTCRCEGEENLSVHRALSYAEAGDILVVSTSPGRKAAVWGGLMSREGERVRLAGVVIDGSVRDLDQIREAGVPVFSRGVAPRGPTKQNFGSVNSPIECGGCIVHPGDLVVADDNGIVAIPRARADAIVQRAVERTKREAEIMAGIEAGKRLYDLLGLEDSWEKANVTEKEGPWEVENAGHQ